MPYEVTATRKRPQGFEQLVGQDFVVSTLKSSVELGRIAHAYLFAGPRGVGKTSAARILAKALNCAHGPTPNPCGVCDQCQEIARGNSLDVIEIDGASNTSVNDVRELKDEVLFAPNSGRYKAYIIDEVHMLSNSAFNALLKTIEEPPPYIVFIFATTEIHKVPATIRSRCQQFNFRLIPLEHIKAQLQQVVEDMGLEAEDEALFWIAKEATGSLRDAYTLFDQIASFSDQKVSLKEIQEKLGLVGIDSIGEMLELMADGRSAHVISMAEDVLAKGVSVEQFIIDLAEYFRTLLFLKHGIEREALLGYHPDRFPAKVREAFTTSQLEYAIEQLLILYRDIRYSLNQRFEMELMLSKLSALREHLSSREMMAKIRELRAELAGEGSGPSESPAPSRAPSPASTEASASTSEEGTAQKKSPLNNSVSAEAVHIPVPHNESETKTEPLPVTTAEPTAVPAEEISEKPEEEWPEATPTEAAPEGVAAAAATEAAATPSAEPESSVPSAPPAPAPAPTPKIHRQLAKHEIEKVIDEVRQSPTLASTLGKVCSWKVEGDQLRLSCDSNYAMRKLKEDVAVLKEKVSEVLGTRLEIKVEVQDTSQTAEEKHHSRDEQVELVKKVFRGEIVDGVE
ncbi:MAG: DNA polymerase III subunit gamma/tau [Spirochaetia bacterium]|nr:DNA polymerase III subunit gamma/tau [Spirochaetia bacterium]